MPIEIKELHVKAVVVSEQQPTAMPMSTATMAKLKKEITDEVLRNIQRQLKRQNER